MSGAYLEQQAGRVNWHLTIQDVQLYRQYYAWAEYRFYRHFFDQDPANHDRKPGQPPPFANPATGRAGEGPRHFHDANADAIRFLKRRRNQEPTEPRYTVRVAEYKTNDEAMRAVNAAIARASRARHRPPARHNDHTDNDRRQTLAAQADALA